VGAEALGASSDTGGAFVDSLEVAGELSIGAAVPSVLAGSSVVQARRAADIARVTSNLPR
jgi:hypothetical protein